MAQITIDIGQARQKLPDDSTTAVLDGLSMLPETRFRIRTYWESHENGNFSLSVNSVTEAINGQALCWPWFDWCLEKFTLNKVWPDIPAWSWFEPSKPEPKPRTRDAALNWLSPKEAKAILKLEGIQIASSKKADVYNALYEHVSFEKWREQALANWQNANDAKPNECLLEQAKIKLLVLTLSSAKYNAFRVIQISELLANRPYGAQVKISPADKAASFIAQSLPQNTPLPNLPPFYPGDRSDLAVVYPNRRG